MGRKGKRFDVIWTSDDNPVYETKWGSVPHGMPSGEVFSFMPPAGARRVFVNLVLDEPTGEKTYPESVVSSNAVTL